MMFEQYVKLFNISWIEPWMVEALIYVTGGAIVGVLICKIMEFLNRG